MNITKKNNFDWDIIYFGATNIITNNKHPNDVFILDEELDYKLVRPDE